MQDFSILLRIDFLAWLFDVDIAYKRLFGPFSHFFTY